MNLNWLRAETEMRVRHSRNLQQRQQHQPRPLRLPASTLCSVGALCANKLMPRHRPRARPVEHNKFGYGSNYSRETLEWINLTAVPEAEATTASMEPSSLWPCAELYSAQLDTKFGLRKIFIVYATPTHQHSTSAWHCMRLCSSISYKSHAFAHVQDPLSP